MICLLYCPQAVRRVTLHRLMPDLGSTLSQLFTTLEIQEPTFTDLVILYRKSKSVLDRPGSDKDQLPNYSKVGLLQTCQWWMICAAACQDQNL